LNEDGGLRRARARDTHRDEPLPILEEVFRARSTDEWIEALVAPASPHAREHGRGGARRPADGRL
jgi:hypothetical protein